MSDFEFISSFNKKDMFKDFFHELITYFTNLFSEFTSL